jgi:hypothetical protein
LNLNDYCSLVDDILDESIISVESFKGRRGRDPFSRSIH